MASDWELVSQALLDAITSSVAGLEPANIEQHVMSPWDPEELESDGKRHLAVWPVGDNAEASEGLVMDGHQLNQNYGVLVWEPNAVESSRLVRDVTGDKALLVVHNSVRDQLYKISNQNLAGSSAIWYQGSRFPEVVGKVRWFLIAVYVRRFQPFV